MNLIDTHAHLTDERLYSMINDVIHRARNVGVKRCITVGCDIEDSIRAARVAHAWDEIYFTAGVHPHEAARQEQQVFDRLREIAVDERCVALGEMGLDYYYDHSPRPVQQKVFAEQLLLAQTLRKSVVIHCRDAMEDCVGILKDWNCQDIPVIFHCYSGTVSQAKILLDRGCFLSFTGTVTFKKALETQEVVRYSPLDRILLETDCPYLSPEPKRHIKPNEPALLIHIAEKVAQLKELTLEEIAQVTWKNSRCVFKLE